MSISSLALTSSGFYFPCNLELHREYLYDVLRYSVFTWYQRNRIKVLKILDDELRSVLSLLGTRQLEYSPMLKPYFRVFQILYNRSLDIVQDTIWSFKEPSDKMDSIHE
jgi:hypothetical protein